MLRFQTTKDNADEHILSSLFRYLCTACYILSIWIFLRPLWAVLELTFSALAKILTSKSSLAHFSTVSLRLFVVQAPRTFSGPLQLKYQLENFGTIAQFKEKKYPASTKWDCLKLWYSFLDITKLFWQLTKLFWLLEQIITENCIFKEFFQNHFTYFRAPRGLTIVEMYDNQVLHFPIPKTFGNSVLAR